MKVYTEPLKAEPLTTSQLDLWLQGKRSRSILVVPFTGPLPGGKAGLDLDGEYFTEDTDLVGAYPMLAKTRERMVDWHHNTDPTGVMKGAIIGRVHLDEAPLTDGIWGDFWANAGEKRRTLLAQLEGDGHPLYGSSEAVPNGVRRTQTGVTEKGQPINRIDVWPLIRHTITTSPQNTHAVVPALKALLDGTNPYEALTIAAFQAALVGSGTDSPLGTLHTLPDQAGERAGERSGKADGLSSQTEAKLAELLDEFRRRLNA